MPVDFRLTGAGLDTTVRLWNNAADQYFTVHVPTLPTAAQFDPNNWILKTATVASVDDRGTDKPGSFSLHQNYPNPFNPTTTISYRIGDRAPVVLKVFDVLGREVATLVNETQEPGEHAVAFDAGDLSSGVYYYQLRAGMLMQSRKMLVVR
jgi:hypothetical protein